MLFVVDVSWYRYDDDFVGRLVRFAEHIMLYFTWNNFYSKQTLAYVLFLPTDTFYCPPLIPFSYAYFQS